MVEVPYRGAKRALAVLLLALLAGGSWYLLRAPGKNLPPQLEAIQDERDLKIASLLELLKLDSEDYKTHAELARVYFSLPNYADAEKHALAAIDIGKKHNAPKEFLTEQYLLLSKIYQAMGDNERALKYAELAAENDPTKTAPLKRKGQVFEAQRKNDKARLAYLRALKLDEKDPETYALLANQEFKKGKKKAALDWLKMGVRRNPENARAFRNLARGYARTGDLEKAKAAYERALKLDPNDAALRFEYAKLLKRMGDADSYAEQVRAAHAKDSKNAKITAALGDIERESGNKERALALYGDALKRDSRNKDLRTKYRALYDELHGSSNSSNGNAASGSDPSGEKGKSGDAGNGAAGTRVSTQGDNGTNANAVVGDSNKGDAGDKGLDTGKTSTRPEHNTNAAADIDAGKRAFGEKDFATAENSFRKALEKSPDNADARFFLARSLEAQGKKDAAMAEYKRLLEKEPNHSRANYHLGRLYYQAHEYAAAEKLFHKSAAADPKFAAAEYSLGLAQEKQGKNSAALAAYRKSAVIDPKLSHAHYNSAILLKKNKKYDEALQELAKSGGGADVEYQRGEIYLKQKKYAEAKDALTHALDDKTHRYEAAFNLALAYHKLGDPAGADRALAKVMNDDSPADLNYTYGKLLEDAGETASAEKQYRASVQKDPRYFKGWLNLGRISAKTQKYDQAENAYRQAAALEPKSYEANFNLANTLYKQKNYKAAVPYFETARRQENSRDVVLPLAASLEQSGQADKAAKVYTEFLGEHAKDRVALEKLGYLYYRKLGNKDKALEQFKKLLQYYPDSDKAQEYKGMIRLIEKQKTDG